MRNRKLLKKAALCIIVVCIMVCGAWGIYALKNEYPIERIEEMLSSNIADAVDDVALAVKDKIPPTATTALQITTQYVMANAGGEIDNSNLTDQEKGYEEYIKNLETSSLEIEFPELTESSSSELVTTIGEKDTTTKQPETTTVKERETTPTPTTTAKERETTLAPTTTAKKQGVVITDEKTRAALIQMGYDPDNYVASDLTFAEKIEMLRLAHGEATSSPKENIIYETVDYSQRTLEYDGPELPKPMG